MREKKLPEVGKRYRCYDLQYIQDKEDEYQDVIIFSIHYLEKEIIFKYVGYHAYDSVPKDLFWQVFEEIPDNSQPEESKPNAVEEALENLKLYLKVFKENHLNWRTPGALLEAINLSEKLVKALEAEKSMVNSTIQQKAVSGIADYAKDREEEIKLKEKPKSIWRPVSELQNEKNNAQILTKNKNGSTTLTSISELNRNRLRFAGSEEEAYGIKEYCLFEDFISEYEDLKARVERLERGIFTNFKPTTTNK